MIRTLLLFAGIVISVNAHADAVFGPADLLPIASLFEQAKCVEFCETSDWRVKAVKPPAGIGSLISVTDTIFHIGGKSPNHCGASRCVEAYVLRDASSLRILKSGYEIRRINPLTASDIPPETARASLPRVQRISTKSPSPVVDLNAGKSAVARDILAAYSNDMTAVSRVADHADYGVLAWAAYGGDAPGALAAARERGWTPFENYVIENEGVGDTVATLFVFGDKSAVLAFRGTAAASDWMTNLFGTVSFNPIFTSQVQGARLLAEEVVRKHPNVVFVGHSLGGRLAQVARLSTTKAAVVFNSAPLGLDDKLTAVISSKESLAPLMFFRSPDDPLTQLTSASQTVVKNIHTTGLSVGGNTANFDYTHAMGVLATAMQSVRTARDEGWISAYLANPGGGVVLNAQQTSDTQLPTCQRLATISATEQAAAACLALIWSSDPQIRKKSADLFDGIINDLNASTSSNRSTLPFVPAVYTAHGACPGEGCKFGVWTALGNVPLFAEPGGENAVGQLVRGERVAAVASELRVLPVKGAVTGKINQLKIGEIVYLLDYQGEGLSNVWIRGKVVPDPRWGQDCTPMPTCVTAIRFLPEKAQNEWWVKIIRRNGQTGWLRADETPGFAGTNHIDDVTVAIPDPYETAPIPVLASLSTNQKDNTSGIKNSADCPSITLLGRPLLSEIEAVPGGGFVDPEYAATEKREHLGTDFRAIGGACVYATASGTVESNTTNNEDPMSAALIVKNDNETKTIYGHIESSLSPGKNVTRGSLVGFVRSASDKYPNFASHLHYGEWRRPRDGSLQNAENYDSSCVHTPAGLWGWGRAPWKTSKEQILKCGWIDSTTRFDGTVFPGSQPDFPLGDSSKLTTSIKELTLRATAIDDLKTLMNTEPIAFPKNQKAVEVLRYLASHKDRTFVPALKKSLGYFWLNYNLNTVVTILDLLSKMDGEKWKTFAYWYDKGNWPESAKLAIDIGRRRGGIGGSGKAVVDDNAEDLDSVNQFFAVLGPMTLRQTLSGQFQQLMVEKVEIIDADRLAWISVIYAPKSKNIVARAELFFRSTGDASRTWVLTRVNHLKLID